MNFGWRYLIAFAFLLSGCGYHHPVYRTDSGGVVAVFAGAWENRSNEPVLEGLLLQKTADWLHQSPMIRLVTTPEQAAYRLNGTIEAVKFPATAFSSSDRAKTLRAWVKVSYRLTDGFSGKVLWIINDRVRERNFPAGVEAVGNRSNKEDALAIIADELAEQIYLQVLTTITDEIPDTD